MLVSFFNNSGEDIPAFGCVRLSDTQLMVETLYMKGAKPNAYGAQYSHGFNLYGITPANSGGKCSLGDMSLAAYDVADGTPAIGEMWGPRDATWLLKKNTGGFLVLQAPDTVNNTVLVLPVPMLSIRGKTVGAITKGDVGEVEVFVGAYGAEVTSGYTMNNVYNAFADVGDDKWVRAAWDWDNAANNGWSLVAAEC